VAAKRYILLRAIVTVRSNGPIIASPNRCVELRGPFFGRVRASQEPDVGRQLLQAVQRVVENVDLTQLGMGQNARDCQPGIIPKTRMT
jgi:hypothetical protein